MTRVYGQCDCRPITRRGLVKRFAAGMLLVAMGLFVVPSAHAGVRVRHHTLLPPGRAPVPCFDDDRPRPPAADPDLLADYDPWQSFNQPVFAFNHGFDRYLLRPVAKVWSIVLPDPGRRGLDRAFDNLGMPQRFVNNLLQGHPLDAGTELARFVVNTTAGVAGFIDVAHLLHLEEHDADMGQTLGVWGAHPGPYLMLPLLPPLTVRDGIGRGIDSALNPVGYFAVPIVVTIPVDVVQAVNERSLKLKLFDNVEDDVIDLYSAVRNAYLQKRRHAVESRRPSMAGVVHV